MLLGLRFSSVVDRDKLVKDTFIQNRCEHIVGKPEFHSKRLSEIWNLTMSHTIMSDMTTRQILASANVLLKYCAFCGSVRERKAPPFTLNIDIQALSRITTNR